MDEQKKLTETAELSLAVSRPRVAIRSTAHALRQLGRTLAPYREPIAVGVGLATLAAGRLITRAALHTGSPPPGEEARGVAQLVTYESRQFLVRHHAACSPDEMVITEAYYSAVTRAVWSSGSTD